MGISVPVIEGPPTNSVIRFQEGAATLLGTVASPCATKGLAISGVVLLVSCEGSPNHTIRRLDKSTGTAVWEPTAP